MWAMLHLSASETLLRIGLTAAEVLALIASTGHAYCIKLSNGNTVAPYLFLTRAKKMLISYRRGTALRSISVEVFSTATQLTLKVT